MSKFKPNMYVKNIFEIDYKKLKDHDIKVLLFDFDNTIIEKGNNVIDKKTLKFLNSLKSNFIIYVVSNSLNKSKLNLVCSKLDLPYIGNARKPFKSGYKKLKFKNIKNEQIAMIGDQLITDVWGANKMGMTSILVNPMSKKDRKITYINRFFEKILFKIMDKEELFKKRQMYE